MRLASGLPDAVIGRVALASVLLFLATAAGAEFRPPDGSAWRYVTTQTRTDGAVERSFTVERRVVFARVEGGYVADLTIDRVGGNGGDAGTMFERVLGALIGRTIRYRLDKVGAALSVDDQDAVWAAIAESIERAALPKRTDRMESAQSLASPLRVLPVERQRMMLASMLTPLIGGVEAERLSGSHDVTVPTRSYLAYDAGIAGRETVTVDGGTVHIAMRAEGDIMPVIPLGTPGADVAAAAAASSHVRISTSRRIDRASGLVIESDEQSQTLTGKSVVATHTITTLTPPVL